MKTYSSPTPPVPLVDKSIFSHLFPQHDTFPGSRAAYIDAETGYTISRAQLKALCLEFAWGVRNELPNLGGLNLKRGDTVMIFSPNSIAWPVLMHGAIAAGLRVTLANSAYTPRELAHQWSDSQARVVFCRPSLVPVVLETFKLLKMDLSEAKKRIVVIGFGTNDKGPGGLMQMEQLMGKGKLDKEEQYTGNQVHETVVLCYSSGTTGQPKGVETTHKNLTSVTSMVAATFPPIGPTDVFSGPLPFYHIYGAVKSLCFPFLSGVPLVIMNRFDPVAFCKTIETYRVTIVLLVPPILVVLARHPAVEKYDLRSLRLIFSGAAPLGAALVKTVTDRLKNVGTNIAISQGYGLTETSPTTHLLPMDDTVRKVGTVGLLLPNLEARLVIDDVEDAPEGGPGELWVKGPTIMKGYLNNHLSTKNSITKDGWFKTGDVAIVDNEGFYSIVDRQKELIKYKGFQVPPAELESVLLQHPDIADAGVIGVDSPEEATELPRAYVVHAKGLSSVSDHKQFARSVQKWVEERVARHKFLRGGVIVIEAIPKSASGKILRRQLRDQAKEEVARGSTVKAKL